jgi:hypothetical protein
MLVLGLEHRAWGILSMSDTIGHTPSCGIDFFSSAGDGTQSLNHVRQVLYH